MDRLRKDRLRKEQGERWGRTAPTAKAISYATGLSKSQTYRLANGESSIAYEHLDALARHPSGRPEAVVAGALAVITRARMEGHDIPALATILHGAICRHQREDGVEDETQIPLTEAVCSLAFYDTMPLPKRVQAIEALERWSEDAERLMDETLCALSAARCLARKLRGQS